MKKRVDSYKGIIEFAIGREIKANRLYTDLSKMMIYAEIRELCKDLAREELEHKAELEKESAKKCELKSPINLSKYDVADSNVNVFMNRLEMFSFAIKKEAASVKLYRDLSDIVKNEDARQMFLWLVEQEEEHKRRFGQKRKDLLK